MLNYTAFNAMYNDGELLPLLSDSSSCLSKISAPMHLSMLMFSLSRANGDLGLVLTLKIQDRDES